MHQNESGNIDTVVIINFHVW